MSTQFKKDPIDNIKRIFPSNESGCDNELDLWDSIAQEANRLSGTQFLFYSLRRAKNRHPLYKEPSVDGGDWSFHGPYEMWGALEFTQADSIVPESLEQGSHTASDAKLWVARKDFELVSSPYPKVGDVIELWTIEKAQPWGNFSEDDQHSQWDIVQANPDGNVFTTEGFVQYVLTLKRRTKFTAVRKTANTKA